ncbi:MAG: hypothetical protein ACI9AB_001699, partial [Urechidicola sp.]
AAVGHVIKLLWSQALNCKMSIIICTKLDEKITLAELT